MGLFHEHVRLTDSPEVLTQEHLPFVENFYIDVANEFRLRKDSYEYYI